MPVRSLQPSFTLRSTGTIPTLLILLCGVAISGGLDSSWALSLQAPHQVVDQPPQFVQRADLFPVHVDWAGEGRIAIPGIHHTRRTTLDAWTGQPVQIELALAEPRLASERQGSGNRAPRIALTFDDGPTRYTPQILDVFAEHGGRCTLFTLGALVCDNKQILQRADEQGHEIGIHSWWHANYTGLSTAEIHADIRRCEAALEGVVQRPIRWLRPPYGAADARVRNAINDAGYRVAMWSVDPLDWRRPGSDAIASHILSSARDGAVVLLHDGGGNRAGTVAAVRRVVPELQKRGFELVTLSELTGLVDPPPAERGMRLTLGDRVYEVEADFDDVRVTVDGVEVELSQPPAMIDGRFLVQARPVLTAMGSPVRWDADALAVSFRGLRGEFMVKLNSLDVTLDGAQVLVKVPSIYYHGTAMLPVWLMANASGGTVQWNAEDRVIKFTSGSPVQATSSRTQHPNLLTLSLHDGSRIAWWTSSSLLSLLPEGAGNAAG